MDTGGKGKTVREEERLDVAVVARGITESRSKAQSLIRAGSIAVNKTVQTKAGFPVRPEDEVCLIGEKMPYVSRGGLKLEAALRAFSPDVNGKCCLDIGASTGGFTDCLLQNGAKCVCAMDVGHGQLHRMLWDDPRVQSLEGKNIRDFTPEEIGYLPDFVCCDVSFISLTAVLPAVSRCMPQGGECVLLIKPQFEAGKKNVGKNGIVRDRKVHTETVLRVLEACRSVGIAPLGLCRSPITGGDGNTEYLLYGKKQETPSPVIDVKTIVERG